MYLLEFRYDVAESSLVANHFQKLKTIAKIFEAIMITVQKSQFVLCDSFEEEYFIFTVYL